MESSVEERLEVDVLVMGGGMAGHSAAGYAASKGLRVMLIEKAAETGGSAVMSGTSFWTAPTMAVMDERVPDGDPALKRHLFDTYREALAWIGSNVPLAAPRWVLRYGRGYRFDILGYFARCAAQVRQAGGWVATESVAEQLFHENGRVTGARIRGRDGVVDVAAAATVLATGGFQANRELLRTHFGETGDDLLIRSNPNSTGDGMVLARSVGAAVTGNMQSFYGHLMMWPVANFNREHFTRLGVWATEEGLLFNVHGERFTDESLGDHYNTQATALQPQAKTLLVLDDFLVQNMVMNEKSVKMIIEEAERSKVNLATANSLDELAAAVTPWGFNGARVVASLNEYNDHLNGKRESRVPRRWGRYPLIDAPFRALELRAGITFTQAGLRIDAQAHVLDEAGTPIPGLFAAGADIGGLYNGGYAGGLSMSCVFGITAAKTALRELSGAGAAR